MTHDQSPTTPEPAPRVDRVARGAWYGLLVQGVDKVLPVVILLYLARTLAPEQFGVYSFLIAYLTFFQAVSDYSIDTVLVRTMSQNPNRRAEVFHAGLTLKLMAALLSAALAVAFVGPASGGQTPRGLMAVAALSLPTALGSAYRAFFRSSIDIRSVFFIAAGRAFLLATGVFAAVTFATGLHVIFVAMATANLTTFLAVAVVLRKRLPPRLSFDRELWSRLVRGAMPLLANALAMTVSLRVGHVLLMSMRGPVEVGLLGAASRVSEAFTLLPEGLMISVYPLMAGLAGSNRRALARTAERSTRYLAIVTGVPVLMCAVAGPAIMGLLFGTPFTDAGRVLSVLVFTALLSATGTVILNLLIAVHQETALYRNTIAFAVVNVVLSVFLIRAYGEIGAAVAMLVSSAGSQVSLALLPSTGTWVKPCLLAGVRVFVAVVAGVAAGEWAGLGTGAGAPLTLALALSVYLATLVVLGVLNREEIKFVRSVLGSMRRGEPEARG